MGVMMKNHVFIFVSLVSMILSGCQSIVPFNDEYRREFDEYLKYVQFYISDKIVLRREIEAQEKTVAKKYHSIRIEKSKKILEITIPENTPGILRKIKGARLFIQFEQPSPDGKERTIPFTRLRRDRLIGKMATDRGYVYQFRGRKILYEGKEYFVSYRKKEFPVYEIKEGKQVLSYHIIANSFPLLIIDPIQEFQRLEKEYRTASGMRLGE